MIHDTNNFDNIRRNLIIFSSLVFFLTLTNNNITSFKILDISFNLNYTNFITTFNEIFFYLLIYFYIRFIAFIISNKKYINYFEDSIFNKLKDNKEFVQKCFKENNSKAFSIGFEIGHKIKILFSIISELFLNDKFLLIILPILYFFIAELFYLMQSPFSYINIFLVFISLFGFFYYLIGIYTITKFMKIPQFRKKLTLIENRKKFKQKYDAYKENKLNRRYPK